MTLIYEYMAIMFIAFLLLAGIFTIGVVLLVIGLVTRYLAKKKQQVKRFPKVLIGLALPMQMIRTLCAFTRLRAVTMGCIMRSSTIIRMRIGY